MDDKFFESIKELDDENFLITLSDEQRENMVYFIRAVLCRTLNGLANSAYDIEVLSAGYDRVNASVTRYYSFGDISTFPIEFSYVEILSDNFGEIVLQKFNEAMEKEANRRREESKKREREDLNRRIAALPNPY